MHLLCVSFVIIFMLNSSYSQDNDEEDEYSGCRPLFTYNYGYKIFFNIPKSAFISNRTIYLPFSVQTTSDAHILFTSSPLARESEPAYELVVGAGWNTFSDIRRLYRNTHRTTNITKNILNRNIIKKFWIKIDNGLISMGEHGINKSFIQWNDRSPVAVKYMSFSSWHGTSAKWYFDCFGTKAIVANKTVSQKLRSYLFNNYDPYSAPASNDEELIVRSNLSISYVYLDPATSSMELRGALDVSWIDNKLQWNPADYDNIEFIKLTDQKIWQPSFFLLNDATLHMNWFGQGIIIVNNKGEVAWGSPVHWITRCPLKMSDWPNDMHVCSVIISYSNEKSVVLGEFQEIILENGNNAGLWEVLSVEGSGSYIVPPYEKITDSDATLDDGFESTLIIDVTVRRFSSTYYYLLYVPLKVAMLISFISFCLSYMSGCRIILQVMVLIMYVINILSIDAALPPTMDKSPKILLLSNGLFLVAIIGTILTVWMMQCSKYKKTIPIPQAVDNLIDFLTLRFDFLDNARERKLMNLEEDEDEAGGKGIEMSYKITHSQRFQAFIFLTDYCLFIIIAVTYSVLFIVYS